MTIFDVFGDNCSFYAWFSTYICIFKSSYIMSQTHHTSLTLVESQYNWPSTVTCKMDGVCFGKKHQQQQEEEKHLQYIFITCRYTPSEFLYMVKIHWNHGFQA